MLQQVFVPKENENNGYMFIGGVRVHQIVATAFHGLLHY
jgi:hypothetical protein